MAITMMTKSKAKASDQKNNNNKQPQTTMRNAKDVSRIIIDKRNKIIECFEKVVELCHVQITRAAENNFTHCIFEVPEFILGYPMYDINECIVHVLKRLKENEYNVSYFFPKIIYVMWPIEENKDDKQYKELLQILNNNSFGFSSAHRMPVLRCLVTQNGSSSTITTSLGRPIWTTRLFWKTLRK